MINPRSFREIADKSLKNVYKKSIRGKLIFKKWGGNHGWAQAKVFEEAKSNNQQLLQLDTRCVPDIILDLPIKISKALSKLLIENVLRLIANCKYNSIIWSNC